MKFYKIHVFDAITKLVQIKFTYNLFNGNWIEFYSLKFNTFSVFILW